MENQDRIYLQMAIDLACENIENNTGGPFGAVIVKDGEVIATGTNRVTSTNDPTAHAEVTAIRNATSKLGTFQLEGCTLYSSCEPCPMCLGAIYWARPDRLVFAADKNDAAEAGFDDSFIYDEIKVPYSARHISTEHLKMNDGLKPFQNWNSKIDKIEY